MSYDQHLAEVGETQALRNLRFYMFPITPEQCLTAIDDREFDTALRYVSWRYSIDLAPRLGRLFHHGTLLPSECPHDNSADS